LQILVTANSLEVYGVAKVDIVVAKINVPALTACESFPWIDDRVDLVSQFALAELVVSVSEAPSV
jgi:hypothetical protein